MHIYIFCIFIYFVTVTCPPSSILLPEYTNLVFIGNRGITEYEREKLFTSTPAEWKLSDLSDIYNQYKQMSYFIKQNCMIEIESGLRILVVQ